jgi:hypothetical protein
MVNALPQEAMPTEHQLNKVIPMMTQLKTATQMGAIMMMSTKHCEMLKESSLTKSINSLPIQCQMSNSSNNKQQQ